MRFTFTVEVEVERTEGKFASRDEVSEALVEAIESADPGSVDGVGADGTSTYEVVSFDVTEEPQAPVRRRRSS